MVSRLTRTGLIVLVVALARSASSEEPTAKSTKLSAYAVKEPLIRLYPLPEGRVAKAAPVLLSAALGRDVLILADVDGDGRWEEPAVDGWTLRGFTHLVPIEPSFALGDRLVSGLAVTAGRRLTWTETAIAAPKAHLDALALLNEQRMRNGIPPAGYDPVLSEGCRLHCLYCERNTLTHVEESGKPGYTEAGRQAGLNSNIGSGPEADAMVERTYRQFLHRIATIHPDTRAFGVGTSQQCACVDGISARQARPWDWPVLVPAASSVGQPLAFATSERPFPYPEGLTPGFPITVTFPYGTKIESVEASLSTTSPKQTRVEVLVSWPDGNPATPQFPSNFNSICLIPTSVLKASAVYSVKVAAQVDGQPWARDWTFRTGP